MPTPVAAIDVEPFKSDAPRGSLSKEQVWRGILRGAGALQMCGERVLQRNPDAIAQLKVRFVIGPKGDVQQAEVLESKLDDRDADACVLDAFRALRFPPPNGHGIVVVTYPVRFCGRLAAP